MERTSNPRSELARFKALSRDAEFFGNDGLVDHASLRTSSLGVPPQSPLLRRISSDATNEAAMQGDPRERGGDSPSKTDKKTKILCGAPNG